MTTEVIYTRDDFPDLRLPHPSVIKWEEPVPVLAEGKSDLIIGEATKLVVLDNRIEADIKLNENISYAPEWEYRRSFYSSEFRSTMAQGVVTESTLIAVSYFGMLEIRS